MLVTETLNEGLKRGYAITLTAAELEDKVNEKLTEAQPQVEMKGFRKGKVPMPLLRKRLGQRLMGEAMREGIGRAVDQHFEDSGERPAGRPDVKMANEDWKEGEDVRVEMSYEALPEIPEVDMGAISLERLVVKADDAAVEESLRTLASDAGEFKPREAGAESRDGDEIVLDFAGKMGGAAFEGGSAEDYHLVLGSGTLVPGFEDQLVGAKAGEERAVTVTFPEDYPAKHLAGGEAVFDCKVKEVRKLVPAEIDDELAKIHDAGDLDALRSRVAKQLESEYAAAARAVMKRGLLDRLDEAVKFDLPPSLVESEAKQIARELWRAEDPGAEGNDREDIEPADEAVSIAERRVRLALLLADVGKKAGIEVTDAEMDRVVSRQARQFPGQERRYHELVRRSDSMQDRIRAPIYEEKVVDHVLENASVTDREVSRDELQEAFEAAADEEA